MSCRFATKAMREPSGDQRGLDSPPSPFVMRVVPEPSIATRQMWETVPLASQSVSVRT